MRRGVAGCGVVLCCGLLFAGGCAKEEIVKKEEPIAAPAPAPQPPPTKPAPPAPVEKPSPQPVPVVKEEPVEAAGAKAAATETKEEASLQKALEKIYFDFDSAALSDAARGSLKKDFALLKKNGDVKVEIEGHCDERGSDEYNLALGERRAKAAMSYLVTLGLSPERLSTISYGKEKPADPGHDEAAWTKNRRAEFVIVK